MTRPLTFILALATFAALSACNTIAGVGQDLSVTGATITQETRQVQSNL
ncbi:entericidin, EcnA/B family [Loktanella sp. 3ANDIMAR09]|nr:entericidin, EcnA/B family [Loktanella sp. 3ANDIMAR09]